MTAVQKFGGVVPIYVPIKADVVPDRLGDINCVVRISRRDDGVDLGCVLLPASSSTPKISLGPRADASSNPWSLDAILPVWYVEVDGQRIFEMSETMIYLHPPRHESPRVHVPWRRRARWRAHRAHVAIAGRLGYVLASECRCCDDDDY